MSAAVSTPVNSKTTPAASGRRNQNPIRSPLSPSEPDNALAPRRPKCLEVTSRCMSSSSSSTAKRSPSPLISRPAGTITPTPSASSITKRSQSAERRRPATTRPYSLDFKIGSCNGVEVPNAQRMLVTSARSLSVSFQGESFSVQVSKAKPAPSPISARKGTPERRKGTPIVSRGGHQVDNSRPVDQQRWPGRLRQPNSMSRSMDWGDNKGRLTESGVNVNSSLDCGSSIEGRSRSNSTNVGSEKSDHPVNSDSESVSSCSTSESATSAGDGRAQLERARFWTEAGDRLCRQPKPASPVFRTVLLKRIEPPKFVAAKKFGIDSKISSPKGIGNTRGQLSPIRGGALRPASPKSATNSSPIRGASPSRVRNSIGAVMNNNLSNLNETPSVLSFAADIRRTKSGEHRIVEVHVLRILYNRLLQWRFANARADSALSAQKSNAEVSLHGALVKTSQLLELVRVRRIKLQWLRQNLKIISILKGQIVYLEELELIDRDFSNSMSGAIEALQASTIRLPVVGGARADIQKVKDAICSSVDVMHAMASSICLLLSKVSGINSLVAELVNAAGKERALLGQCNHLLSVISAIQVKECSLRTHFLQVGRDFPA